MVMPPSSVRRAYEVRGAASPGREGHHPLDERLGEVVLRLAGEVHVRVDQPRQQRRLAQVDHLRVRRRLHAVAGRDNPSPSNHHRPRPRPRPPPRRTSARRAAPACLGGFAGAPLRNTWPAFITNETFWIARDVSGGSPGTAITSREPSRFQRSRLDAEQLGGAHGRGLQRLRRRESPARQPGHLLGIGLPVLADSGVAAEGDAHPVFCAFRIHLRPGLPRGDRFLRDRRGELLLQQGGGARRIEDGPRDEEHPLLLHQRQRVRLEEGPVLDGVDTGLDRHASRARRRGSAPRPSGPRRAPPARWHPSPPA